MPRRARPWFRRSRGMFFVQIDSRQHPLGITDPEDVAGADRAHEELLRNLASHTVPTVPTSAPQPPNTSPTAPTVKNAATAFLAVADRKIAAGKLSSRAVRNYRISLAALVADFSLRRLDTLTAEELEVWANRESWSASYQNTTLGTIGSLLRFHKVTLDPPIHRPPKESRGAETCLTDDQFAAVLANVYTSKGKPGDLIPLLKLLRECGCRPAEAAALTVERIDWSNRCTILTKHKTKRKTGENRVIVFNSAAMAVLQGQRERYGSGVLFRTRGAAKAYGPNVIVKQLLKASERVGFRVIAYGLGRHSFATRALINGVPEAMVAALLGQKGTGMLTRHYSHVGADAAAMRSAAERATRPPSAA